MCCVVDVFNIKMELKVLLTPFFLCLFTVAVYAGTLKRNGKKRDLERKGKKGKFFVCAGIYSK